ncbi:MAG: O-antigen ligase family protein [Elusimicrobia bacterium]|nr:O-antigen ligase family protein [Candidatus Liberimonas magnetica]
MAIAMITFRKPADGLIILVFSMLLSPEIKLVSMPGRNVVLRVDDLLLITVFLAWLAHISFDKDWKGFVKTPLDFPLLLLFSIYFFSTILGVFRGEINLFRAIFYVLKYFEYFVLYWITANIITSTKDIPRYLIAALITCIIVALYAYSLMSLSERVYAPFDAPTDLSNPSGEPASLGGYLLIVMAVIISMFITMQRKTYFYLALFIFLIPPLMLTLSRASIFGFALMLITILVLSPQKKLKLLIIFSLGIMLFPIIMPEVYQPLKERLAYTFKGEDSFAGTYQVGGRKIKLEGSANARVLNWERCFEEWLPRRPFFGHGVTGVGLVDTQFPLFLGEIGLVGFFTFVYVLFTIYTTSWHILKNSISKIDQGLALGLMGALTALLMQSVAVNTFIIVRIMEPFWFLTGLVVGVIYANKADNLIPN